MGQAMCRNLTAAGYALRVCDLSAEAVSAVRAMGSVEVAVTAEAVAAACDVVMLSLPGAAETDSVMLGPNGVLAGAHPGLIVLDTTTIGVAQSQALARAAHAADVAYLDAPVSIIRTVGGPAEYTYMVGGDAAAFERARPVLAAIAGNVVRLGASGAGTAAKLINQVIYVGYLTLFAETVKVALAAGLELEPLLAALATSSAGLPNVVAKYGEVLGRANTSFPIDNGLKYLDLAGEAFPAAAAAPMLRATALVLADHARQGIGKDDLLAGPIHHASQTKV
jgi:3-hydroxyisobutyrate dehydrogenase-like beta-hydroxyacid dehydrogenase